MTLLMQNAKMQDLTPIIEHLFWWVPEKEKAVLVCFTIIDLRGISKGPAFVIYDEDETKKIKLWKWGTSKF